MNSLYITLLISLFSFVIITTGCETTNPPEDRSIDVVDTNTKPSNPAIANLIVADSLGRMDTILNQHSAAYERVQFYALDSLLIDANYYHANDTARSILLCHQARWNKYEYDSIAVVLQSKGYNCLAIDQRSGGVMDIDGVHPINATYQRAIDAGLPTEYLDAEQDIVAAINFLYTKAQAPIILWGSSYSATLALYHLNNDKVFALVTFSPGNYFSDQKGSLVPLIKASSKPFFITSSKKEAEAVQDLIQNKTLSKQQIQFIPKFDGYHGAKALWASNSGNEMYWAAINSFLESLN